MKLRKKLPEGRTYQQVLNHYLVEKELADKLKGADREGRKKIYATMYDELFRRVPDHPRLSMVESSADVQARNLEKLRLLERYLSPQTVFAEFAPGDGTFALSLCSRVKHVYTIDISDQAISKLNRPANFTPIIYDGYTLDHPAGSIDVAFSDHCIEHLMWEDIEWHFTLIKKILRPGGLYAFRVPHAYLGPHDVSKYFCSTAQGFHLHECTYSEIAGILTGLGYHSWQAHVLRRKKYKPVPFGYIATVEKALGPLPRSLQKFLSRPLLPRFLFMVAEA
jgi:SAM-dependent methyltransferase